MRGKRKTAIAKAQAGFPTTEEFKSGRKPTAEVRGEFSISNVATTTASVVLVADGWRGKALGMTEKSDIKAVKDGADGLAKQIYEMVVKENKTQMNVRVSEGFGRDGVDESFKASEVINPGAEHEVDAIIDVIEGTNMFATNNNGKKMAELSESESGATSVMVTGEGVAALGNVPDVYADAFFTRVPPERTAEFKNIDPSLESYKEIEAVLSRVAEANGITLNEMEIVLMKRDREGKRLASLKKLQIENPGLEITIIEDGTVAHGLLATFGRKEGKHKVMWTVGGSPEQFMNLAVAGAFRNEGAVAALRVYSKKVNDSPEGSKKAKDLSWKYNFSEEEKADLRKLRPDDAEDIIAGERLFTLADVKGPIEGAFTFITDNGVFQQPGIKEIDKNKFEVSTLRVREVEGKTYAWTDSQIIDHIAQAIVPQEAGTVSIPALPENYKERDNSFGLLEKYAAGEVTDQSQKVIIAPAEIFLEAGKLGIVGLKEALEILSRRKLKNGESEFVVFVPTNDALQAQFINNLELPGVITETNSGFDLQEDKLAPAKVIRKLVTRAEGVAGVKNPGCISVIARPTDTSTLPDVYGSDLLASLYGYSKYIVVPYRADPAKQQVVSAFNIFYQISQNLQSNRSVNMIKAIQPVVIKSGEVYQEIEVYLKNLAQALEAA